MEKLKKNQRIQRNNQETYSLWTWIEFVIISDSVKIFSKFSYNFESRFWNILHIKFQMWNPVMKT